MRRLLLVMAAVALVAAAAPPAAAHSGSNALASLHTEIIAVPDGLEAQVQSDGTLITVRSSTDAVVQGYQHEPFVRFAGESVFTNADSLTTYDASDGVLTSIPATAGHGKVRWTPVADPGWFAWPDHRIAWDGAALPTAVMDEPGRTHQVSTWSIPVTVDGVAEAITGRIVWEPTTAPMSWTIALGVGLVLIVIAVAAAAAFPRRPRARVR